MSQVFGNIIVGDGHEKARRSLETRLGYSFRDEALLVHALTHRSHGRQHNERLEFLGDSILNCSVATLLFQRFPEASEGELSRLRANLVKQDPLHQVALSLDLPPALILGEGERRSGGHQRPSILADTVEALIGAIYLEGGFETVQAVISRLFAPSLASIDPGEHAKDAKTRLQEHLQGRRLPLPRYEVVATHGQAHHQRFEVCCRIRGPRIDLSYSGHGESRRKAEQAAAKAALQGLQDDSAGTGVTS